MLSLLILGRRVIIDSVVGLHSSSEFVCFKVEFVLLFLSQVVLDPALRERHLGDLQGLTLDKAAKQKPAAHKIFLSSRRDQELPVIL